MELELWIPYDYDEEFASLFELDEFLDEISYHISRKHRDEHGVRVVLSEVTFADEFDQGVGITIGGQDGYTVPDAEIRQAVDEDGPRKIPESDNEYMYTVVYQAGGWKEKRSKEIARAGLEADLGGRDVAYRIDNETFIGGEVNRVEFEVAIPGDETGHLTVPTRLFATAEEIQFSKKRGGVIQYTNCGGTGELRRSWLIPSSRPIISSHHIYPQLPIPWGSTNSTQSPSE
jgi:hypothetical protein